MQDLQWILRIKFNEEITDEIGSITATIFAEKAKELYNITPTEMFNNTGNGNLPIEIIEKLSAPKECTIILRAYMYTYGAISQCVFNVHATFNSVADQQALQEPPIQLLGPNTPKKRGTKATSSMQSPINEDDMEEDQDIQPLKTKHKKE